MKIKYEFADETVEIEVTDEWGSILIDLDRQEYNNNQTQTRRHCSLDALNLDETLLPSDEDVLGDVITAEENERLQWAIGQLKPHQQDLVRRVHFKGEKLIDIAREQGVTRAALSIRMKVIYANLKKFLS